MIRVIQEIEDLGGRGQRLAQTQLLPSQRLGHLHAFHYTVLDFLLKITHSKDKRLLIVSVKNRKKKKKIDKGLDKKKYSQGGILRTSR